MPTSTDNKINQTHPILVDHPDFKHKYLVTHNGIIRNDDDIKEEHEKEGFKYTTIEKPKWNNIEPNFNDSETIAIEIAKFIEKKSKKIKTIGSAAIIGLKIDKKTNKIKTLFFVRNGGNPIKMSMTRNKLRLSSEGEGELIPINTLYETNINKLKLKKKEIVITESTYEAKTVITTDNKPISSTTETPPLTSRCTRDRYHGYYNDDDEDWNDQYGTVKYLTNDKEDEEIIKKAERIVNNTDFYDVEGKYMDYSEISVLLDRAEEKGHDLISEIIDKLGNCDEGTLVDDETITEVINEIQVILQNAKTTASDFWFENTIKDHHQEIENAEEEILGEEEKRLISGATVTLSNVIAKERKKWEEKEKAKIKNN
jgi:hypothetical protein